jgi:hypothetical protein
MPLSGMPLRIVLVRTDEDRNMLLLLVIANFVPISLLLVTLMMEAISSSETSVLIRDTASHPRRQHSS